MRSSTHVYNIISVTVPEKTTDVFEYHISNDLTFDVEFHFLLEYCNQLALSWKGPVFLVPGIIFNNDVLRDVYKL